MANHGNIAPGAADLRARLAKNARARRLRLGKTQREIAAASNLAMRHYQKVEAGQTNANPRTLVSLAEGLGVTVPWLLEDPATHRG